MTADHIEEALAYFKKADPTLYKAAKLYKEELASRVKEKRGADRLFASLAASVVSQQLSTKAADTIWKRLTEAAGGSVNARSIAKLPLPVMRAAGLSNAKTRTLKELAKAVASGLDLPALRHVSEEEAVRRLSAIWGIGTWTAEMFLIFALGRKDVFSVGDLGLLRSMETLYGIEKGSPKQAYLSISDRWSPYRSFACLVLWRHRDGA